MRIAAPIPYDQPFTTEELENYSMDFWQLNGQPHMEQDCLQLDGREYRPKEHPVVVGRGQFAKELDIPTGALYRGPDTDGKWIRSGRYRRRPLCTVGETMDVLMPLHQEPWLAWHRFFATEDPELEQPTVEALCWKEEMGSITITGASNYAERIWIPAEIAGLPVKKVFLPAYSRSRNLRELVVAEGVEQVYADFSTCFLERVEIPATVQLVEPPNGIRDTVWFRSQPEGDVYFHGYYCGSVGSPERVVLKEGTIGIISGAHGGEQLREVVIPASVQYIGLGAFWDSRQLQKVILPPEAGHLLQAFAMHPNVRVGCSRYSAEGNLWELNEVPPETGEALYRLVRGSVQVRSLIPAGYEPVAPRLRHGTHGWEGEIWYCCDDEVGYYLRLRLPSCAVVEKRTLKTWPKHPGCFLPDYLPPYYHLAADYLDRCVEIMRQEHPGEEDIKALEARWNELLPNHMRQFFSNRRKTRG